MRKLFVKVVWGKKSEEKWKTPCRWGPAGAPCCRGSSPSASRRRTPPREGDREGWPGQVGVREELRTARVMKRSSFVSSSSSSFFWIFGTFLFSPRKEFKWQRPPSPLLPQSSVFCGLFRQCGVTYARTCACTCVCCHSTRGREERAPGAHSLLSMWATTGKEHFKKYQPDEAAAPACPALNDQLQVVGQDLCHDISNRRETHCCETRVWSGPFFPTPPRSSSREDTLFYAHARADPVRVSLFSSYTLRVHRTPPTSLSSLALALPRHKRKKRCAGLLLFYLFLSFARFSLEKSRFLAKQRKQKKKKTTAAPHSSALGRL